MKFHSTRDFPQSAIAEIERRYRPGVRGSGAKAIASALGLNPESVRHVTDRIRETGSGSPQRRGRKHKLRDAQERRVAARVDDDPFRTNRDLAASFHPQVTPRTISNILHRQNPPIIRKRVTYQEPEERTPAWKASVHTFMDTYLEYIPLGMRVYADECGVYLNEAPRYCRGRRGVKIICGRSFHAKRLTLHVFAKQTHVLHWDLSEHNADDNEVVRVATAAAAKWTDGDVLIWDRLGRSGRCRHPTKQHFNPQVAEAIEDMGGMVLHLPPKGKYLDPMELLFNDLKEHYLRRPFRQHTFRSLKMVIKGYMDHIAPRTLPGFFRARANGRDMIRDGILDE